jgi:hypothetical protein
MLLVSAGLACALAGAAASSAAATVIANTYDFTASRFAEWPGGSKTAPFDPVTGSFTLTFDTATGFQQNQTTGLVFHSLDMPVDAVPGFPLFRWTFNPIFDALVVESMQQPYVGSGGAVDAFELEIRHISTAPVLVDFLYSSKSENAFFEAHAFSLNLTPVPNDAVPEPATWAMAILGLAMTGAAIRRRRGAKTQGGSPSAC